VQLPVPDPPNSACFLTNVWGTFQSSSDMVRVSMVTQGSAIKWQIFGLSGGGSPAGDAWCITGSDFTLGAEAAWLGSGPAINMPKPGGSGFADTNDSCFLMGISGNVSNAGDNSARVRKVNGIWQLEGIPGVKVFARCINHPAFAEQTITPGTVNDLPGLGSSPARSFHADHDYFCALTRVHGSLRGGWIGTYIHTLSDTGGLVYAWRSNGFTNPNNSYLAGTARCTM